MTEPEWQEIARQLQAPFDPADVEFRPQGKLNGQNKGRALAYVDARVVAARLDAAVGPQNWTFTWEPVILDKAIRVVKGTITIYGISKSDVGDADNTEPSKASVSDSLKRAAVLWGLGRYLYSLEAEWVQGTAGQDNNWYIPDSEIARLRKKLPRPGTPTALDAPGRPQAGQAAPVGTTPATPAPAPATLAPAGHTAMDESTRISAALETDQQRVRTVLQRRKPGIKLTAADVTQEFITLIGTDVNFGNASAADWRALADALEAESPSEPDADAA